MRQLFFVSPGSYEWREAPEPTLEGPREALVRPVAVAACDLDGGIARGQAPFQGPFEVGHEFVADVVEAGPDAGVSPGDRAVVSFQISCGECERCRAGRTGNCTSVNPGAMYGIGATGGPWGGALADVVRVPYADTMLFALPDGMDPVAVASASDNIPDGWRTVAEPLEVSPGAPVLIVGGGAPSIALYAVDIARALGAERIDYLDRDTDRLALAEELGARPLQRGEDVPDDQDGFPERLGRYPVTVDAGGQVAGLGTALRSTEPDGTCTSVGIYFGPATPVPLFEMYVKGITFHTGRVHACAAIPAVLDLAAAGRITPEKVTSRVAGWEEAPEALADPPTKLVIARDGYHSPPQDPKLAA
jgi:threonine dehydrogenase-like Zn-dependent dehydrogenase